ncbi:hypothetical protein lerEdw1_020782 [Lerista edwardsae]|nr:hypothetical protein lerEdw1_020782 [Lerista edwardsae]
MNAPRPEPSEDEIQVNLGSFSRVASGGSFVVANVPPGIPPDVFPPCKIIDLDVAPTDDADEFLLSWTAPGNDYDVGTAETYEIKMSENPLELRDATFQNATSVNTSGLTPAVAGTRQSLQFKPENVTKENGTTIYFAIRAIDNSRNVGEASNIARAVLLMPPLPTTPSTGATTTTPSTAASTTTHSNLNENSVINVVTVIVIIACASAIIICVIVSITICVVKRKNRHPETEM